MNRILLIFLVIGCLQAFEIVREIEDNTLPIAEAQKIPSFMGLGYHILLGNPFTNHVDSGFKAPIFDFTFSKNQTTDDNKYLIPDFTQSRQTTSCSVESKVTQFSGTLNYQKYLANSIKIDTRFSIFFVKFAFSYSKSFEEYRNFTETYN